MKKKNTFKFTLLVAFVLCITGLFILTGCGDDSSTTDIYVKTADAPRLTYVQGQELDLTDSMLTAVVDGAEIKVALTDENVKVAGYDKDKLGEQAITVTYEGLSTTINVTVISRTAPESYETKYFVGDEFKKDIGKIKIATDKAEYFTVNMKDDKISLVSFDSSASGTSKVTVRYTDGAVSYDCSFDVTVYDPATIEFTAPKKKTEYLSHETSGLAVSDGYFTVTSSDGKLTKIVPLTADMVSGFDLTKATMANRKTPLVQELTAEYLGKKFTYDINILFSGVSVINYYAANDLANIDWSAEQPMTDDQREAAVDAITEYYELSDTDKELISAEVKSKIAAAGAVAVSNLFYEELSNFSKTFRMDTALKLYLPCESYEQTAADLVKLQNNEEKINVYAKLLRKIETDFATVVIKDKVTVADQIYVYTEDQEQMLLGILEHLVSVNSQLVNIPDNWTVDTLDQYGKNILAAAMQIYNATYYEQGSSHYYTNILSSWRTKKDTLDILYSYFLYVYDTDNNPEDHSEGISFMTTYMFGQMPMLGDLNTWYTYLNTVLTYEKNFASYGSNPKILLADVSTYMYYYFKTLEISDGIKNSGNQLWVDIYNAYNGDYMNEMYMYAYSYGYLYHTKGMADSVAYAKLWAEYYDVMDLDDLTTTEAKAEIMEMLETFELLTPSELLGFLSSMHFMYVTVSSAEETFLPLLAYDKVNDEGANVYSSLFNKVLRDYYFTYMTENARPLAKTLLTAMENYALIGYREDALESFKTAMAQLVKDYTALDKADQDSFTEYFGDSYAKYLTYYEVLTEAKTLTLTADDNALFASFKTSANKFYAVYNHMVSLSKEGKLTNEFYAVLYALYSDCTSAYNNLLAGASDDAKIAVYTNNYEVLDGEMTVAQAYYLIDNITLTLMTNSRTNAQVVIDGKVHYVTVWDLYNQFDFDAILDTMSDAFYAYYDAEGVTITKEYVLTLVQTVRNFSEMQARVFAYLSADKVYYSVLDSFLDGVLSNDAAKTAGDKLIEIEKAYTAYRLASDDKKEAAKADFIAKMAALNTEYASLAAEDKAILDVVYTYYLDVYEELTAATPEN